MILVLLTWSEAISTKLSGIALETVSASVLASAFALSLGSV